MNILQCDHNKTNHFIALLVACADGLSIMLDQVLTIYAGMFFYSFNILLYVTFKSDEQSTF